MAEDVCDQGKLLFQRIHNSLFGLSPKKESSVFMLLFCQVSHHGQQELQVMFNTWQFAGPNLAFS